MKMLKSLIIFTVLAMPCLAADTETRLQFKTNGFSIAPLEGVSETTPYQAVMMFLPVTEAFAPNVNVQIQPYGGTLKEYSSLSKQQFKAGGFTVLNENITKTDVVWEYSGMFQGRKLHWYAKATMEKGKVYLVTATATESQWKSVKDKLKTCVDSFKKEDSEQKTERDK